MRKIGGWAALPAVTGALAAFAAGTGYLALDDTRRATTAVVGSWVAPEPATTPARAIGDPFRTETVALSGTPSRLRIPAIGVDTALDALHLAKDGTLTPPVGYLKAGWYAEGTPPGDVGPAVIAGHVDSRAGPAVFYRLRDLEPGDRIEVNRGAGTVAFVVTATAWYPKTAFPTALVYGPTPDRQLRLITCGGVFDRRLRSYSDDLVVYAAAG